MGGWLSSIFTGSSPGIKSAEGGAGTIAGFGTSTGMGDTRTASDELTKLIGGDPAAISKILAPQIGQVAGQANQKIQTEGQFANRSGGTNASNAATIDASRASIDDMISRLTGGAIGELGQMGENLLHTGLSADELQAKLAQQELENNQNSLLGGIISKGVAGGLGMVPGLNQIF